jgi:xanthine/uracil/vitamin C permease (AzgA family)
MYHDGLTAIIAALLFIPFLFPAHLLSMIPSMATAPALVLVGPLCCARLQRSGGN